MNIRILLITLVSLCLPMAQPVFAAGSSGGGGSFNNSTPAQSPEELAERAFRFGVKYRDRALKQEAKAAAASTDKKREKALAKAQKLFAKAIKKQGEVLQLDPQNYKAANELGYALRKTGDYRRAIGAYNYALELNPNFHQAIEYRGEAFLALGRYDDTRTAYMALFRNDRELADQLMSSIVAWIEKQDSEVDDSRAAFISWAEERQRLAKVTQDLSSNNTRAW